MVVDNSGAAYEATRHLISLGHVDIAIIAPQPICQDGVQRIEGFRKAMQEARLPISRRCIFSAAITASKAATVRIRTSWAFHFQRR